MNIQTGVSVLSPAQSATDEGVFFVYPRLCDIAAAGEQDNR